MIRLQPVYAYAKGLLDGLPEDQAKEKGLVAAIIGRNPCSGEGSLSSFAHRSTLPFLSFVLECWQGSESNEFCAFLSLIILPVPLTHSVTRGNAPGTIPLDHPPSCQAPDRSQSTTVPGPSHSGLP